MILRFCGLALARMRGARARARGWSGAIILPVALPQEAGDAVGTGLEQRTPDRLGQGRVVELDAQDDFLRALIVSAPGRTDLDRSRHEAEIGRVAPLLARVAQDGDFCLEGQGADIAGVS